jgi:hypothetical protein
MSEVFEVSGKTVSYSFKEVKALSDYLKMQFTRSYDRKGTSFYNQTDSKVIHACEELGHPIEIVINVMLEECILSHPSAFESSKLTAVSKLVAIRDYKKLLRLIEATCNKYYAGDLA